MYIERFNEKGKKRERKKKERKELHKERKKERKEDRQKEKLTVNLRQLQGKNEKIWKYTKSRVNRLIRILYNNSKMICYYFVRLSCLLKG